MGSVSIKSVNVQYFDREPVRRYTRANNSSVGGSRLSVDGTDVVDWFIAYDPEVWDYNQQVLELYSEKEVRWFERYMKNLINPEDDTVSPVLVLFEGTEHPQRDLMNESQMRKFLEVESDAQFFQAVEAISNANTLVRLCGFLELMGHEDDTSEQKKRHQKRSQILQAKKRTFDALNDLGD